MQTEAPGKPPERRRRRGARSLIRAALFAGAAALLFSLTAASASAEPSTAAVTVDPETNLISGSDVTVTGTGFEPAGPPPPMLDGLYVAQAAKVSGAWKIAPGQEWIAEGNEEPEKKLNPDGSFKTSIQVVRVFTHSGTRVDCHRIQCVILTRQAHGNPEDMFNPIFTQTPITFARSLSVDPRVGLSPTEPTAISVSGANYEPTFFPDGLKIAQAQLQGGAYAYGPAVTITEIPDPEDPTQFKLSPLGFFAADVQVNAKLNGTGGPIDCEFRSCQIIAWPANEEPTGGSSGNVVAAEDLGFAFEYSPRVSLSQRVNLPKSSDVTVEGTGFPAGQPGLYVTQAVFEDGKWLTAARDTSGTSTTMKFVRPGAPTPDTLLKPDGSFATAVTLTRTFTIDGGRQVNCVQADCRLITWRAHTNPDRDTVFTSTPLVFRAAVAPRINVVKRNQLRIGRKARVLRLAAIRCGSEPCAVRKPNRVVVRVGKRKMRLALAGPRRIAAGKRAQLRLRVTGKAARALVGRRARIRFRVVVRSDSGNQARVVNRVLVGARKVSRGR